MRAGRTGGQEDEVARTLQQTPESQFARLYDWLDGSGDLKYVGVMEADGWDALRRGEIIEAEVAVSVSTLSKFASLADQIGPLMQFMETFSSEAVDPDTTQALEGFRALGNVGDKVPVVARIAGSPTFKLIAPLSRENLRMDVSELDGEATMLLKLHRKLQRGEKYTILDSLPGLSALPRQQRREFERSMKNDKDIPDAVISPPAAVVTPVAIYR